MHGTDLGQSAAVGDVDRQLSGVDAADEVGTLRGVVGRRKPAACAPPAGGSSCPDVVVPI
jgi:hypothetical protein